LKHTATENREGKRERERRKLGIETRECERYGEGKPEMVIQKEESTCR
jgi:hypothetical protein